MPQLPIPPAALALFGVSLGRIQARGSALAIKFRATLPEVVLHTYRKWL